MIIFKIGRTKFPKVRVRMPGKIKIWDTSKNIKELCEKNLRFVGSLASKMNKKYHNCFFSYKDWFQYGCIGLIKAAYSFDESRKVPFVCFAKPRIMGEMKAAYCTFHRLGGIPAEKWKEIFEKESAIRKPIPYDPIFHEPIEKPIKNEEKELLDKILCKLPEQLKDIVIKKDIEEISFKCIAIEIKVPLSIVSKLYEVAILALKKLAKNENIDNFLKESLEEIQGELYNRIVNGIPLKRAVYADCRERLLTCNGIPRIALAIPYQSDIALTFNGETLIMKKWADKLGVKRNVLNHRISSGWHIKRALQFEK